MSIYHMRTYLLMRGPGGPDEDDPMLKWIAEQDKKKAKKTAEAAEKGYVGTPRSSPRRIRLTKSHRSMFTDAKDSIKMNFDWKSEGPAKFDDEEDNRQTSFKVPRPKIDHLPVLDTFNPAYLEEVYQNHKKSGESWSKFIDEYCSDDEDDPANGRISPCTFLRWAEGAKRWDAPGDKFKSVMEERKEYEIPVST